MALRKLSPNHTKTPLQQLETLMSDGNWETTKFRGGRLNLPESPVIAKPAKRMRPALTLDIPMCTAPAGDSLLSLRRQNSWTEGSLADTANECKILVGEEAARAQAFVQNLVEMQVKVLAIDFDLTLVGMHTGGRWWGSAETLSRNVRPLWKTVVPLCQKFGIEVSVVTLSRQTKLISNVLKLSLDCDATKIRIRGGEGMHLVTETGDVDSANTQGCRKQKHIDSILQSRIEHSEGHVAPHQIVLVDDDSLNVHEALDQGMRGLLFNPDNPLFLVANGA